MAFFGFAVSTAASFAAGWKFTIQPTFTGTEVFVAVLRDAPQAFVTKTEDAVWRFIPNDGWQEIADAGGGDPALYARDGELYVAWGAGNGTVYDSKRPAVRITGPGSPNPISEPLIFSASARGKQHESLWAFDQSGEGRVAGNQTGLPAPPAMDADYYFEVTDPTAAALAKSWPYRVDGLEATALPVREQCVFPSPVATAVPGIFGWGCLSSILPLATYDFVREGPGGDTRIAIDDSVRTFPGGARHLFMDDGSGVPATSISLSFPRPSLAYSPAHDSYVAIVSQTTDFGPGGIHWYWSTDVYASTDGGSTWTFEGRLCGWEGRDCLAGSVSYDDAADRFWISWLQRGGAPAGSGTFDPLHVPTVAFAAGDLSDGILGSLVATREEIDEVSWEGLANGQIWMTHGAHDGFVALGYWKAGETVFAYKQFE